ncbi:MAG: prefoldin subunit beta [Nitrososphaerota archaeon]
MSEEEKIPPHIRQQILRLQQLQQTLEIVVSERQRIEAELVEINNAIEELGKTTEDSIVYKLVGRIMIKSNKENLKNELMEKKEIMETRSKVLEKQEERTRAQLTTLQKDLQKSLSEAGISTS